MKKEEQKQHLIDIMKSDEESGLYKETFAKYWLRLRDRRTEDIYPYTDYDLEKYRDYIFDCYTNNLSVYKCLEWMSFAKKEILPQQIWNEEKMESVKQIIKGQELFKESNDRARKVLSEIKSLPIQETVEKILCAAIWLQEVERAAHRPINTPGGVVISGFRHGNCISSIVSLTGKRLHEHGEHIQGFLTDKNRFVDRKEGAKIWIENGGILKYSTDELYSEDLY